MNTVDTHKVRTRFEPFTTLYEKGDYYSATGQTVGNDVLGKRNDKAIQRMVEKVPDAQEMINRLKWEITGLDTEIILAEKEIKALQTKRADLDARVAFYLAKLDQQNNSITLPQP